MSLALSAAVIIPAPSRSTTVSGAADTLSGSYSSV